jgi:hypothetical protein
VTPALEASTAKGTSSVARPLANVRWEYALFAAVAVAGIAMRVAVSRSTIGALEGDEATWGLMARHVLDGELSAFFWGQAYGGTQEVALVGALFSVFGTHLTLMRLVPVALTLASAFVVWRIGRRTIGELPALVAAFLLWVWPAYLAWKLQIWHGFYGTGLLYASLVLLLVLRLAESPTKRDAALLGLVLGLAFWQTLQILAVAAPALVWLTLRRPAVWRLVWVALPGFVLGALPWFLSNLRHDWWSFRLLGDGTPYLERLRGYGAGTFPMILGLRVPFSNDWLLGQPLTGAIYVGAACLFAYLAWRWRRTPMTLFVLVVVADPFL